MSILVAVLKMYTCKKAGVPVNTYELYMRQGYEKEAILCKKKRKRMEILFEIKSGSIKTWEAFVYEC